MSVYLICGPPCSGKSTFATKRANPGDVILDFDTLCAELDGHPGWTHSKQVRERAGLLMDRRIALLPRHQGTVYVIRSAPDPRERTTLARQLNAQVWMCNPGMRECTRRARVDRRPARTVTAIRDWYAAYRPALCDIHASAL